ncbi:MAG TPA: bifunctional 4-hydroxy-2-oxoglutarate aldolase/2-dehydro-3-deoxy-phosphogluconate aldolase [Candidatus Ornithospirochaeta avicola]|uniref:2-dehydro-3-deoxy-phosphogluconate aldolase n=1 Tax=Candidatus Ornithospirochaeta avicola TaxID=2840896 RepID=A0A9D1TMU0_9SPIO|nr:bifunctional 4-hydroxy-2-oxoglutarate aldolase/2-dehydro-3-deoxy-phosphogluconate aldolase [Candidatus Ornithospirochaeta avicola]
MTKEELFKTFHDIGLVPVVKIDDASKAERLAKAMIDGGIPCAEVTFRTDAAEEAIRRMTKAYPEMLVGAGTVINAKLAEKAVNAGARFIVSPGFNPETVQWCLSHNIPVVPGVATPSEIERGLSYGLDVLKFFPSEASGGVAMLKDLSGPFSQVKFMTTGGININNLPEYAKCPNVLAIGGSWMVKSDLIANDKFDEITRLCKEAVIKLQGISLAHIGINLPDAKAASEAASDFAKLGLEINEGNSSIFMNKDVELMKKMYLGTNGHIAFRCYDVDRTIYFLKNKGFTVNESTVSKDAKGNTKVAYFNEELAGFAFHLVK